MADGSSGQIWSGLSWKVSGSAPVGEATRPDTGLVSGIHWLSIEVGGFAAVFRIRTRDVNTFFSVCN